MKDKIYQNMNMILEYKSKKKIFNDLEKKRADLLQEEATFQAKLISAKQLLHDSEIEQIQLLRRAWPARKLDNTVSKYENLEAGSRANVCAPGSVESDLAQFRAGIDSGLVEIYGHEAVKEMRSNLQTCMASVEAIKSHLFKLKDDIELLESEILIAKKELTKSEQQACGQIFDEAIAEARKKILPEVKRLFVLAGLYDPYRTLWTGNWLHYCFPPSCTIDELLAERDKLRKEYFK